MHKISLYYKHDHDNNWSYIHMFMQTYLWYHITLIIHVYMTRDTGQQGNEEGQRRSQLIHVRVLGYDRPKCLYYASVQIMSSMYL